MEMTVFKSLVMITGLVALVRLGIMIYLYRNNDDTLYSEREFTLVYTLGILTMYLDYAVTILAVLCGIFALAV